MELTPTPYYCKGCGAHGGYDDATPVPSHCEKCPPWKCTSSGQMDSIAEPCTCWKSFEGMRLADIKGIFAVGAPGLSIDPQVKPNH